MKSSVGKAMVVSFRESKARMLFSLTIRTITSLCCRCPRNRNLGHPPYRVIVKKRVCRWSQMLEQIRSLLLSWTGFLRLQARKEP